MKQCPRCNRTYSDDDLNFCLDDGEMLFVAAHEDAPPTVMLNEARRTNPVAWPSQFPSVPPAARQQQVSPKQFSPYDLPRTPDQTLAVVSLGLGIASVTIGWCCSLGLLLSPAALITGFIALSRIKNDPAKYSGRGLAIGGIVTGMIFICFYLLVFLIWGLAAIGGSLGG